VVAHGARVGQPGSWVGSRWRAARPGRGAKSRRLLAVTVILDAAAWSVTGIGWMVDARVFDWSETLTGAPLQSHSVSRSSDGVSCTFLPNDGRRFPMTIWSS